jgi:hypothetical protein
VLAPKLKPDPPVWGVLSGVVLAKGEALLWKLKAGAKVFVVLLLLLQAAKLKPPIWEGAVPAVGRLVIRMRRAACHHWHGAGVLASCRPLPVVFTAPTLVWEAKRPPLGVLLCCLILSCSCLFAAASCSCL